MNPDTIITSKHRTTSGGSFRCSVRTEAHLDSTIAALAEQHPGAKLQIIQGCYHDGPLSAGTHDFDAVLDFRILGLSWADGQRFLRQQGWAAWWRHTGTWSLLLRWHFHAVSLGYTTRVGEFVPGQVDDYYHDRDGLAGHAADHTWHPRDIDATKFDFALWEREMEDDMPYTDWSAQDRQALADDVAEAVWERAIHAADERQASSALAQCYLWLKGLKK